MVWPVLIIATLTSVLAAIACFASGVRNLAYVVPTQWIAAIAVSYAVSAHMATPADPVELFWTCVLAATFVPIMWLAMRQIVGPLQRRRRAGGSGSRD